MDLIIVIFGSTGDLTFRKLLPAIARLYRKNQLPEQTKVIALGRKKFSTDEYLENMANLSSAKLDLNTLSKVVSYHQMEITDILAYQNLLDLVNSFKHEQTRELYYLAIGPELFPEISNHINVSGLVKIGNLNQSIIFEKPFGHDLSSAKAINEMLWNYFDEKQIYRIDHYLGKEMIQNIMMVRFANRIFEEIWHNRTIKNVKIISKETDGILGRAGYYDQSGALRDMIQSHLLQMLSLIAMEVPLSYFSDDVKNEKVKVLNHLHFDHDSLILGQYDGYLNEHNIPNDSKTETFVFLRAYVNTPRFKGVPFYLMSGKKLDTKESLIIIEFEETSEQRKWDLPLSTNKLLIKIDPKDGVGLVLNSKVPGLTDNVEQVELEYCINCNAVGNKTEAYEKLIIDMVGHHKTLFTRWDEIELSWHFIDTIKKYQKDPVIYKNFDELLAMIKDLTKEDMK
ncbi:MAG: glucose-6-phosphate dehydrogenase [Acholeplasmataceae bacterium]|nr:glucose-6-phosphate dehydrogenase [Acholeplasmataceae bacterium]